MLEAAPAWNGGGQWPSGEEERPAWEGEGLPDWESAPAAWDHDSAQKLAEQLLVVQVGGINSVRIPIHPLTLVWCGEKPLLGEN